MGKDPGPERGHKLGYAVLRLFIVSLLNMDAHDYCNAVLYESAQVACRFQMVSNAEERFEKQETKQSDSFDHSR